MHIVAQLQEEDLTEQDTALERRDSLVQPLSDEPGGDSSDQLDITAEDDRNDETFGGSAMPAQPSPDVETFGGEACHEDRGDYINDETFGEDAQNEVSEGCDCLMTSITHTGAGHLPVFLAPGW
jgi:hypothetical protein